MNFSWEIFLKILDSPPGWSASVLMLIFAAWLYKRLKLSVADFRALKEAVREVVTFDGHMADAAATASTRSTLTAGKAYKTIEPIVREIRRGGKSALNLKSLLRIASASILKI
jgi:hypothetical protein